tara:strand:+ start:20346 stop:21968 length:1623 start_codon:yes stop_codon:yes gene_type:complete
MPTLIETLSRIGAADLSSLIGVDTIAILERMGGKQVAPYKLSELVIRQFGADQLLLEQTTRVALVETLSEDDALLLCNKLNLPPNTDPWGAVLQKNFPVGSVQARTLFEFFGCEVPIAGEDESLVESSLEVVAQYPLFDHQIVACRRAAAILEQSSSPRVLLHMPTGAGKTRTAMNLIAHFARHRLAKDELVIWLAHSEELCEQAAEEFEESWNALGIRNLPLHRAFGSHKLDLSPVKSGVLVGGLQMMFSQSQRNQSDFLKIARKARLVVMDEAHQAIAPTYKHILDMLAADPKTAVLGLSATPGRSTFDAMEDIRLAEFFSRQKVTLEVDGYQSPVDFLQSEGYLAKVKYERIKYSPSGDLVLSPSERLALQQGLDVPGSVLKKLGADERRNLLVLTRILEMSEDPTNKIIVFACSVDHAHLIANILTVKGVAAAAVTSRTRSTKRRKVIQQFRDTDEVQVLTNYGVLTTGFDAPRTNTAVIARPTDSVVLFSQMVGRAARGTKAGGNKECNVITIVDELPGFRSIAEAFEYWDDIWE